MTLVSLQRFIYNTHGVSSKMASTMLPCFFKALTAFGLEVDACCMMVVISSLLKPLSSALPSSSSSPASSTVAPPPDVGATGSGC